MHTAIIPQYRPGQPAPVIVLSGVDRKTLSTPEVCAAIPISRAKLYRLAKAGKVQPIKIGNATRWPVSILDDALAGRLG